MSEVVYSTVKFTNNTGSKVDEKGDGNVEETNKTADVVIYENFVEPKLKDKSTADQQKITSENVGSRKKKLVIGPAVLLGLLSLLLLVAIIVLVLQFSEARRNLSKERDDLQSSYSQLEKLNYNLSKERDDLQSSYSQLEKLNYNLSKERDDLQSSYSQLEKLNFNLTQNMSQLEAINGNLTRAKKELQTQLSKTTVDICAYGKSFGESCYLFSNTTKNWYDSKTECEKLAAHLVTISSEPEQKFITSNVNKQHWIGLTDEEEEGIWKWVNGEPLNKKYWAKDEPSNGGGNEDCAAVQPSDSLNNWNDLSCQASLKWICEKQKNQLN